MNQAMTSAINPTAPVAGVVSSGDMRAASIPAIGHELAIAINDLDETVSKLYDRLSPVLRPMEQPLREPELPSDTISPHAAALAGQRDAVNWARERLENLLAAVEF